jgi:threonine-phosphate decarboxylase
MVGAGTTELIGLLGLALRDELLRIARDGDGGRDRPVSHLVEPTYGEYRRTAAQNGLSAKTWDGHVLGWDQRETFPGALGIIWTGHPNNPTGRAWDRARLIDLAERPSGTYTIVDEAYLPFLPDEAERTLVQFAARRTGVVVLRSMTKIYSTPGLRLGYLVADPELVERLRQFQPPWSISTAAEAAALASLADDEYLERTVELISTETERMTDRLWNMESLRPTWPSPERPESAPPPPNFVLASVVDTAWTSNKIQDALARRGLLVRECSNYRGLEPGSVVTGPGVSFPTRGHLRFTVRTPGENDLLLATLAEVMRSAPPEN